MSLALPQVILDNICYMVYRVEISRFCLNSINVAAARQYRILYPAFRPERALDRHFTAGSIPFVSNT